MQHSGSISPSLMLLQTMISLLSDHMTRLSCFSSADRKLELCTGMFSNSQVLYIKKTMKQTETKSSRPQKKQLVGHFREVLVHLLGSHIHKISWVINLRPLKILKWTKRKKKNNNTKCKMCVCVVHSLPCTQSSQERLQTYYNCKWLLNMKMNE